MPYEIVQVKPRGYYVVNSESGKRYSKLPITKKNAYIQHRILSKKMKGDEEKWKSTGGELEEATGGGFLDSIKSFASSVSQKAKDVASGIGRIAKGEFIRRALSPADQTIYNTYFDMRVNKIQVFRKPLQQYVGVALNAATLGKWNQAVKKEGFDKLFHLGMIITLGNGMDLRMEKKETVVLKYFNNNDVEAGMSFMNVPIAGKTILLKDLFEKPEQKYGKDNFWVYEPFNQQRNCQGFVKMVLEANGLATPDVIKFVYQDATQIIDSATNKVSRAVLGNIPKVASFFRTLTGSGLEIPPPGTPELAPIHKTLYDRLMLKPYIKPEDREVYDLLLKSVPQFYREQLINKYGLS